MLRPLQPATTHRSVTVFTWQILIQMSLIYTNFISVFNKDQYTVCISFVFLKW